MSIASAEPSVQSVDAQISYLLEGSSVNRRFAAPGIEVNTSKYKLYPVKVHNARTAGETFTLDKNGFALFNEKSAVKDFLDKEEVNRVYPKEVEAAVKRIVGATRVAAGGWMMRTSEDTSKYKQATANYNHAGGVQPPAADAHVDYLPESADRVAKMSYDRAFPGGPGYKRFIAGSFWRCFSPGPQDWPLALCDGRSVGASEGVRNTLIVVDKIPSEAEMLAPIPDEDLKPQAAIFRFNPNHKWWYFPNMNRDEALIFKFHDSDRSKAWRVPHTAFHDTSAADAKPRQSVEVRFVAFFE